MWTAPFPLGSLLQVRVQADQVVGPGTRVTQDDFSPLLANLTVVLVVGLVSIPILCWEETSAISLMDICRCQSSICLNLLFFFFRPLLLFFLVVTPRASESTEALWMLMSSKSDSSRKSSSLWEITQSKRMHMQRQRANTSSPSQLTEDTLFFFPLRPDLHLVFLALGFLFSSLALFLRFRTPGPATQTAAPLISDWD